VAGAGASDKSQKSDYDKRNQNTYEFFIHKSDWTDTGLAFMKLFNNNKSFLEAFLIVLINLN